MCSACRLQKCFTSGMQAELIRGLRYRKNLKKRKKKIINNQIHQVKLLDYFKYFFN